MSQSTIHSHQYQHFDNLQLSAHEFYTMVETMVKAYEFPKVAIERTTLKEAGLFSSSREYLCISQKDAHYFVCAAPFGKSFFISWWLKEQEDALSAAVQKVPLFAFLSGKKRDKTFYELDSETMFMSSINSIIHTAVNQVMKDKGYTQPQAIVN